MYLLDTNACIRILNNSTPEVVQKFSDVGANLIAISSVVRSELAYGARHSTKVEENLRILDKFLEPLASVPYDNQCADVYGIIRADLAIQGTPIGPADLMIAATAKAKDLVLVSNNTREFSRIAGLRLEDWQHKIP